jgi:spoIIIJ-associated protein
MSATEITAHDIETAIRIGLAQLDLLRAEVKIEVIDEGNKGVLGIGAKPARVRLTPYAEIATKEAGAAQSAAPVSAGTPAAGQAAFESESESDEFDEDEDEEAPEDAEEIIVEAEPEDASETETDVAPEAEETTASKRSITPEAVELAATLTQGVLDRMDFAASCTSRLLQPPGGEENPSVWVDIQGADSSHLLAHQCEALDALQVVVQTMWAHQTKSNLRVTVDADSYKDRREKRIQQMAERLAERVVSAGRSITLEPMPASERRLVHIALRDHPQVKTESQGEGSGRRITIKLK